VKKIIISMQKLHLLRRYIREAIDLGNIQFAPARIDKVDTSEPNTPEEEELYNALSDRLGNFRQLDQQTADKLKSLINSSKYGEDGSGFFGSPEDKSSPLYRGHAYPREWAEQYVADVDSIPKVWGGSEYHISDEIESFVNSMDPIQLSTPYTFGPNRTEGFRGWSPSADVATTFAIKYQRGLQNKSPDGKVYAVILILYPYDNNQDALLDFSSGVYKTKAADGFRSEKEVLNLAPVQCSAAYVFDIVQPTEEEENLPYE